MNTDVRHVGTSGFVQFSMREFLVDFLGGLVPGILFAATVTSAVTFTLYPIVGRLKPPTQTMGIPDAALVVLQATSGTPSMLWIGAFTLGTILSYTIGHLFYRRDPKDPNRRSFERVVMSRSIQAELRKHLKAKRSLTSRFPFSRYFIPSRWVGVGSHKDAEAWVESKFIIKGDQNGDKRDQIEMVVNWLRENLGCACPSECEFPYPHLDKYLAKRNHKDLADRVHWEGEDGSTGRSKTFINKLKIRLESRHPEGHRIVVRNEAHVRLATSTWYVGRASSRVAMACLAILGGFTVVDFAWHPFGAFGLWSVQALTSWYLVPISMLVVIFLFTRFLQWGGEVFIHYQRLREVFFVLSLSEAIEAEGVRPVPVDAPNAR